MALQPGTIGAGRAINTGPDALRGFPYLPVHFFLIELALEFQKLAEVPVLVFLLLGKQADLNEINGHSHSMAFSAPECKPDLRPVFLRLEWASPCRKYLTRFLDGLERWMGLSPVCSCSEAACQCAARR